MDYRQVVVDELQIPGSFFRKYRDTIRETLTEGADIIYGPLGILDASNLLFSLTYGISQLGAPPERADATLRQIEDAFPERNPATIIDAAILRHLLDHYDSDPGMAGTIDTIKRRFDEINWMTSEKIATRLGMTRPIFNYSIPYTLLQTLS